MQAEFDVNIRGRFGSCKNDDKCMRILNRIVRWADARLRVEAQKAIDDVLLPQGESIDQFVDAATILRERAYTETQIGRLAGELGKDLKMLADLEGRNAQGYEQEFGHDRHQVALYHRIRDASLIEAALSSFKRRDLYLRVMEARPDPIRARREQLLDRNGRGRSRSQRQRWTADA